MTRLLVLVFLSIGIFSCSDQDILPTSIEGTYEGTFTMISQDGTTSNEVSLDFENGTFNGNSTINTHPAVGTGAFKIKNGEIRFTNASFWTANFDWNLILDGEFELNKNGNQLIFTKNINQISYKYDLKKSK